MSPDSEINHERTNGGYLAEKHGGSHEILAADHYPVVIEGSGVTAKQEGAQAKTVHNVGYRPARVSRTRDVR